MASPGSPLFIARYARRSYYLARQGAATVTERGSMRELVEVVANAEEVCPRPGCGCGLRRVAGVLVLSLRELIRELRAC